MAKQRAYLHLAVRILTRFVFAWAALETLVLFVWVPMILIKVDFEKSACVKTGPAQLGIGLVNLIIPALAAVHLMRVGASPDLRNTALFAAVGWLIAAHAVLDLTVPCDGGQVFPAAALFLNEGEKSAEDVFTGEVTSVNKAAVYTALGTFIVKLAVNSLLVMKRAASLEAKSFRPFGVRQAARMATWIVVAGLAFFVCLIELRLKDAALQTLVISGVLLALLAFMLTMLLALMRGWRALERSAKRASGRDAENGLLAARTLKWQAVAFVGSYVSNIVIIVFYGLTFCYFSLECPAPQERWRTFLAFRLGMYLSADYDALLTLSLAGALSSTFTAALARARSEVARLRRQRLYRSTELRGLREREKGSEEAWRQWDEKVEDLAARGLSIKVLLDFYRQLPKLMPHYDHSIHTTSDVVRQVIIPQSAAAKSALAPLLMEGRPTKPDMMVTHAWSNSFRDLVAAVCADALEETDYHKVNFLLMTEQIDKLEGWLNKLGQLNRSYWICAFAVNQHLGICGSISRFNDPVTGKTCDNCACGCEKVWNDTAPLLPDGRSTNCEMNKFDDMMSLLSLRDADFGEVVAVDASFRIFSRAWGVAEIALANKSGMRQIIKVMTAESVEERSSELQKLRIQDMEAAVASDKEFILQRIGNEADLERFNVRMRDLLLKDLLPAWSSLDPAEQMSLAGTMLRWEGMQTSVLV